MITHAEAQQGARVVALIDRLRPHAALTREEAAPMSARARMPLAEAEALAAELVDLLAGCCEELTVAGSIRRRAPTVGDVELVGVPRHALIQADLFAPGEGLNQDLLAARCLELLAEGVLAHRPDVNGRPAFGERYKRLRYRGFPLDLFSPPEECFGVVLAIRTGPAEFSRRLVTPRRQGGLLPDWLRVRAGRIWRGVVPLDTPTEASVFEALNLDWLEPEARTGRERAAVARG